eukprot:16368-Heterococcus_DN1.PRE.1
MLNHHEVSRDRHIYDICTALTHRVPKSMYMKIQLLHTGVQEYIHDGVELSSLQPAMSTTQQYRTTETDTALAVAVAHWHNSSAMCTTYA